MAVKSGNRALPDTYYDLVEEFPLAHIRDDGQLREAGAMIDRLLREELDEGSQEYLDALTDLVEIYEDERFPLRDVSDVDVLRALMAANRLSQPQLAKAVGISQSTISAVLNGTRKLTRGHILKLAAFFGVRPAAFLPA